MNLTTALKIFGLNFDQLQKLSRSELRKIYLQLAQTAHPDAGGSSEEFIQLQEAYSLLKQEIPEDPDPKQRDLDKIEEIETGLADYVRRLEGLVKDIQRTLEEAEIQTQQIIEEFEKKREELQKNIQELSKKLQEKQQSWIHKILRTFGSGALQEYENYINQLKQAREQIEKKFLQEVSDLYGATLQQMKEKLQKDLDSRQKQKDSKQKQKKKEENTPTSKET